MDGWTDVGMRGTHVIVLGIERGALNKQEIDCRGVPVHCREVKGCLAILYRGREHESAQRSRAGPVSGGRGTEASTANSMSERGWRDCSEERRSDSCHLSPQVAVSLWCQPLDRNEGVRASDSKEGQPQLDGAMRW